MITSGVIITSIICFTILCIAFIIGYFSNEDKNNQKLKDIYNIVNNFKGNYVKTDYKTKEYDVICAKNDILNLINTIKDIIY